MPPALTRPAHVLMTTDAVGGVWRHTADLADGLAAAGVRVTVVTLGPPPAEDQVREIAALDGVDLLVTALPLDWTAADAAGVLAAGCGLEAIARRLDVDVVHLHSAAFAAGGSCDRPTVVVHHSCVATWWEAMRDGPLPADLAWRTDLVHRGLSRADAVVAPSAAFAAAVQRRYALRRPPAVVLNGAAAPASGVHDRRERTVLTAGRLWDEAKGAAVLDAAAARLDAPVRAAGPVRGPDGGAFAPERLELLGRLDRRAMAREMARAGVFVSLARYEPFGLAVLEAALAGCPLVLADIPTFRELWAGAALFVDPTDPAAVAAALGRVLDDGAEADALAGAARRRAERYGPAAVTEGFLAIYGRLAAPARELERLEAGA